MAFQKAVLMLLLLSVPSVSYVLMRREPAQNITEQKELKQGEMDPTGFVKHAIEEEPLPPPTNTTRHIAGFEADGRVTHDDFATKAGKDDPDGDAPPPPPPPEGSLAEGEALDKEDQVVEKAGDENFAMEESDAEEDHEDDNPSRRRNSPNLPEHRRRYECRRRRGDALCNSCESCGLTGIAWKNCYYASKDDNRRRIKLPTNPRRRGKCVHPRHDGTLEDKDKGWCKCLRKVFERCDNEMACLVGDDNMGPACSCNHMCPEFKEELECESSLLSASPGGQQMSVANNSSSLDEVLAGKRTCG